MSLPLDVLIAKEPIKMKLILTKKDKGTVLKEIGPNRGWKFNLILQVLRSKMN